ncbi:MAG: hypothetical protein QOI19_1000, partial [Thermoleophilaceae bacterium]|nr:hypothetical protein [Thermoleophilaceae bacterium]
TFDGTQNGGCDLYNTCGYAGTVTYTIGGTPHGKILLTRAKNGRVKATARYKTAGVTRVHVTPPDGGAACTDTISHTTDVFSMSSQGSHFQNLVLNYHPSGADYLDSTCAGPNEGAVSDAGVLPRGVFQPKAFFKGNRPKFTLSGGYSFRAAGFSSAIDWKLSYKLNERACSPRCKFK